MSSISRLFSIYHTQHIPEQGHLARLTEFLEQFQLHSDLISRTNYTGHITASGFVLSPDHTRILLIAHRALGIHVQPGGHLDPSDASPLAGARREVFEETGISSLTLIPALDDPEVPFDIDTHHIPANLKKGEPEHWHHDFRYLFRCKTDVSLSLAEVEVDGASWVPVGELHRYLTFERVGVKLVEYLKKG